MDLDKTNVYQFGTSAKGSHAKIISLVGKGKKVLDVGCNKGYLSQRFKENGCMVVGMEGDADCANIARKFCDDVITVDVEQINTLTYPEGYFEVIVFADVLEHLKEPKNVLLKLKRYLNHSGFVIVSLPNIARLDIRIKLLFGNFDYEEAGIMDKTHLHFYTLFSAKRLLTDCGFQILKVDYTGELAKFMIFPTLTSFQFIITAKKVK